MNRKIKLNIHSPKADEDSQKTEKAQTILFLDADTSWVKKMGGYFLDAGHDVEGVGTLSDFESAVTAKKFDLFILNLFVNDDTTIPLVQKSRLNNPTAKIIWLLDDGKLIEEGTLKPEDLILIGGNDIFIKPVGVEEIISSVENANQISSMLLHQDDMELDDGIEFERKDDAFTWVPLIHFTAGNPVMFNTYVRLGKDRYVKVLSRGDSFSEDFLNRYVHHKGIKHFHFAVHDRIRYINKCNEILGRLAKIKSESSGRVIILNSVVSKYLEEVYSDGLSNEIVELGKNVIESLAATLNEKTELKALLDMLEDLDPEEVDHGFLVAFLANMIASQYDWFTPLTSETLSMACIFHDIGKTKMPRPLVEKSVYLLSSEELETYQNHPIWGAEIVSTNPHINPTVPHVILQHHECFDGTGFPYGFPGGKCLVLSGIVFFSDLLAKLMKEKKISSIQALQLVLADPDSSKKINPEVLRRFCEITTEKIDID